MAKDEKKVIKQKSDKDSTVAETPKNPLKPESEAVATKTLAVVKGYTYAIATLFLFIASACLILIGGNQEGIGPKIAKFFWYITLIAFWAGIGMTSMFGWQVWRAENKDKPTSKLIWDIINYGLVLFIALFIIFLYPRKIFQNGYFFKGYRTWLPNELWAGYADLDSVNKFFTNPAPQKPETQIGGESEENLTLSKSPSTPILSTIHQNKQTFMENSMPKQEYPIKVDFNGAMWPPNIKESGWWSCIVYYLSAIPQWFANFGGSASIPHLLTSAILGVFRFADLDQIPVERLTGSPTTDNNRYRESFLNKLSSIMTIIDWDIVADFSAWEKLNKGMNQKGGVVEAQRASMFQKTKFSDKWSFSFHYLLMPILLGTIYYTAYEGIWPGNFGIAPKDYMKTRYAVLVLGLFIIIQHLTCKQNGQPNFKSVLITGLIAALISMTGLLSTVPVIGDIVSSIGGVATAFAFDGSCSDIWTYNGNITGNSGVFNNVYNNITEPSGKNDNLNIFTMTGGLLIGFVVANLMSTSNRVSSNIIYPAIILVTWPLIVKLIHKISGKIYDKVQTSDENIGREHTQNVKIENLSGDGSRLKQTTEKKVETETSKLTEQKGGSPLTPFQKRAKRILSKKLSKKISRNLATQMSGNSKTTTYAILGRRLNPELARSLTKRIHKRTDLL